jgi:(2R)-sulfolactate sulfo-lyase subunit alpha
MKHNALIHDPEDDVAVVVVDVKKGDTVSAVTLEGKAVAQVTAIEDVPLGHKVAMRDLATGKKIIKYDRPVGVVYKDIKKGAHVHTQNIKTERWQKK